VESTPAVRPQPRERISFSQLAYFLQCPVRYELAIVYGMETFHPDPVDFGANVHRALLSIHERALAGIELTDAVIEKIVEDSWLSPVSAAENPALVQERDARKAAVKQLRRYMREHASDLKQVERAELPFSFSLQESVLLGRIDLIRKDEDGIEVVDFKTSEASKERAEQEQVETQLDIYALGAEIVCGKRVTKRTAHFLGSGEVKSWPWSSDKAARTRQRLAEILGRVAARSFEPRTEFCARCTEFQRICMHAGGKK
jgi:DNA helicase-2/ATP-dependent DNA helicase PcrA